MNYTTIRTFFDGMLCMMLLYTFITYLWQRKKILAYYGVYIISVLFYLAINDLFFFYYYSNAPLKTINHYDFALGTIEAISFNLYGRFAIVFMDLRKHDRLTVKLINAIAIASLISICVHGSYLLFGAISESVYKSYETVNRYFLAITALIAIVRIVRLRNDVVNFFKLGSLFYVTGMLTAVVMIQMDLDTHQKGMLHTYPMLPTQIGMIMETVCFTIGFSVLNRRTELEKLRFQEQLVDQLLENEKKQQKLQLIRDDIARDLHDEIGSDLSALSIMSDMGNKLVDKSPEEAKTTFATIGKVSRNVLSTMREIVWSLNSTQDSVESMGIRMRDTAYAMFEYTATEVHIDIPAFNKLHTIQPNYRRDFLLIYKEILHNVLKHANASNVFITLSEEENFIALKIKDDGLGFVFTGETSSGNGLKNLRQRSEKLNGNLKIVSAPGVGTVITVNCPTEFSPKEIYQISEKQLVEN